METVQLRAPYISSQNSNIAVANKSKEHKKKKKKQIEGERAKG
jgi:lipocalin